LSSTRLHLREGKGLESNAGCRTSVERTTDIATLDEWLGNILDANTLGEVGIPVKK
jgi:hypothetical protein